ncbi:hypothetical protein [Actinoalloteichus fjordicus]|nr:hypothetical protein [Actinoalloteichus fjordicus]
MSINDIEEEFDDAVSAVDDPSSLAAGAVLIDCGEIRPECDADYRKAGR